MPRAKRTVVTNHDEPDNNQHAVPRDCYIRIAEQAGVRAGTVRAVLTAPALDARPHAEMTMAGRATTDSRDARCKNPTE